MAELRTCRIPREAHARRLQHASEAQLLQKRQEYELVGAGVRPMVVTLIESGVERRVVEARAAHPVRRATNQRQREQALSRPQVL